MFYAIGNIGDSKKTDRSRLVDPTDRYEFINEICDVELPLSDWPNTPEAITALEAEKFDKSGTYEWRYIWEDGTDEENAEVFNYCKQKWIDMYKFVVQSTDEEFKSRFEDYFVLNSVLYYYLFTTRYCMVDNRAKNSFWHYGKTGEVDAQGNPIRKWDLAFAYDCDSSMSLNNYGNSVYRHGYEDTDTMDGTDEEVFRESDSTFFCRVRDLFADELKEMYNTLESKNAWHSESFLNEIEAWQKQFPEELWRLDCIKKYVDSYTESFIGQAGDPQYLKNMAQGRMLYPVKQWERSQEAYMASKYQSSLAASDNVNLRCTVPTGDLAVQPNYKLTLTPYDYMYLNVKYGTQEPIQLRANPGVPYEIPFEGNAVDILDIYSASRIQDLGDLSTVYPATVSTGNAIRLKELHVGNSTEGYDNPYLTTMTLGANYLLEVLNVENVSGLTSSLNLSVLNNLRELYAHGTNVSGVTFASGGNIQIAELPAIGSMIAKNLSYLTNLDISDYSKLTTLTIENCSTIDIINIFELASNLNRVRITGIDWVLTDDTLLDKVYKMAGFDLNGDLSKQSVLTGKVHVPVIREQKLKEYNEAWNDLEITYDQMIEQYPVTFKNENGTVLDIQYVDKGENAVDPITRSENPIPTPTKESTVSHDFTYAGWDDTFTSIRAPKTITATYTSTIRKYEVQYVVDLGNIENVWYKNTGDYGSNVPYAGERPTYTSAESAELFYWFDRWEKSGVITEDKIRNGVVKIRAIFDSCQYENGYFDGKELKDLRPVEIYTLIRMNEIDPNLKLLNATSDDSVIQDKDMITFKMGHDVEFDDIESTEIISESTYFNGTNHIDTGIKLFDEDRDFVLAIDYKFDSACPTNGVIAQCYDGYDSIGFKLWNNSGIKATWGSSTNNVTDLNKREMIIIRHIKGDQNLYIYNSKLDGNVVETATLIRTKSSIISSTLVFGAAQPEAGSYENNASGCIYWAKIWYTDLGEDVCKKLALWTREDLTLEACGLRRYYLSDGSGKRCSFSLLASHLLSKTKKMNDDTNTNIGGWGSTTLNAYINDRFYQSIPDAIRALIKQVKIPSSIGNASTEVETSSCYIAIPSCVEMSTDDIFRKEPYNSEGTTISYMTSPASRIRKYEDGTAAKYWLRSPNTYNSSYFYAVADTGSLTSQEGFNQATSSYGILVLLSM